jgi:hypothetical protein
MLDTLALLATAAVFGVLFVSGLARGAAFFSFIPWITIKRDSDLIGFWLLEAVYGLFFLTFAAAAVGWLPT